MLETNSRLVNTALLQKYKVISIEVARKGTTRNIKVPDPGSSLPPSALEVWQGCKPGGDSVGHSDIVSSLPS